MNDLISRQAAIDALHMHLMYRMGTDSNKKRLDDWINGVPSAQPERWIPASERLPEPDERVLVYTVGRTYGVWDAMPHRADNYAWEDETGLCHDKWEVDMWMPLPEPWKEVE